MPREPLTSIGLLLLRLVAGGLLLGAHGLPKLLAFAELSGTFADPIGIGSAASLSLAIFSEVLCAGLVVLGLGTRIAAVPVLVTMVIAAFFAHGGDPLADKELALLYLAPFATLTFTGAGQLSLDVLVGRRRRRPGALL